MKRLYVPMLLGLVIVMGLVACSQGSGQSDGSDGQSSSSLMDEQVETIVAQISADFDNALSPAGQLALGTLQLEDSELAISEEQAVELLPLWQAMQSLSNSETTAQVELDAVAKQIEQTMSSEQVATIASMKLTTDSLTEMMDSGALDFRGFGGRNTPVEGEDGVLPPLGGFGGGPGGDFGPPGGGAGGGPGGGFGPGSGGGFGGGDLSEDDIATRRAEFAESGLGDMSERFLTGAVVRLLQSKTGETPTGPGGPFETIFQAASNETGLSVEEIQAALAEGQSLAQIIESHGGDVEAVRAALIEALEALPNADSFDAEQQADQWLNQQQQSGQE